MVEVGEEDANASNLFCFHAIAKHECNKYGNRNGVKEVGPELPYGAKIRIKAFHKILLGCWHHL